MGPPAETSTKKTEAVNAGKNGVQVRKRPDVFPRPKPEHGVRAKFPLDGSKPLQS